MSKIFVMLLILGFFSSSAFAGRAYMNTYRNFSFSVKKKPARTYAQRKLYGAMYGAQRKMLSVIGRKGRRLIKQNKIECLVPLNDGSLRLRKAGSTKTSNKYKVNFKIECEYI